MTGSSRERLSRLGNVVLFLFLFDVAAHSLVGKLVALDLRLDQWYARTAAQSFVATVAPDGPPSCSGAAPAWYAVYWSGRWLECADASRLGIADWSFAAQTLLLAGVLLLRRRHVAIDGDLGHQAIAVLAFGTGVFFLGEPSTGGPLQRALSEATVVAANLLAVVTLLNLGRSFGILIALRRVQTRGLYGVVRHPMYATDILGRLGYLIGHVTPVAVSLFVVSTAAYVTRAVLEERFLDRDPGYRDYRDRVRFRLVPGVF